MKTNTARSAWIAAAWVLMLLPAGCKDTTPAPGLEPAVENSAADAADTSQEDTTLGGKQVVASGAADTARFAVAWSTAADPAAAGKQAAQAAIEALGCPAKAVVFYTYYQDPDFVPDEANQATACKADVPAEQAVAKAVDEACGNVPNVGCRARCLTNGGTLLRNAVAVLAAGGEQISAATCAVEIQDDRLACGKAVAEALKGVEDLKLVIALAEMRLSFEAKQGVSVEDFIRGVLENAPKDATLFGGNSMPDDMQAAAGLAGAQFKDGRAINGHVVALGIGGPINAFANHTNEFKVPGETVTVTETKDKWIITLDDEPAEKVYRRVRGMKDDEQLTSDWQHPIGVVVAEGKQYVRMILNWVDADGKDKDGKQVEQPPGSLCFIAPVVKGSKVKILGGGDDPAAIVAAARQGIEEAVAETKAAGRQPALCLLSDCCARGMRLRTFGQKTDDEVTQAILPAMGDEIPLFGFYAWGELGRIKGRYEGLSHQYQQHTFVSTLVGIKE